MSGPSDIRGFVSNDSGNVIRNPAANAHFSAHGPGSVWNCSWREVVSWIYCASLGSIFSGRRECSCGFNTEERSKNVVLLIKGHNNFPIIQLHSATCAIATFSYCHGPWTTKSNYMGQKQSQISNLGSQQIQVWNLILLGETIFSFINWPIQARNWL